MDITLKAQYAEQERAQEAEAFWSDPDFRDAKPRYYLASGEPATDQEADAIDWLKTYTGDFVFLVSLQKQAFELNRALSVAQVGGLLKCYARAQREAARPEQPAVPLLPEGRRHYAVYNALGENDLTFLRITRTKAGWTYIDQQISSTYEPRGRVNPRGQYFGQWQVLYEDVVKDPVAAMTRYGHELGICGYCHRTLTNQISRELGIGPVCRQKGFGF